MNPSSHAPLSRKAEALLSAERQILPQPELVRRRALLRARTALWSERSHGRETGGGLPLWRRVGLVAAAALVASTGLAAWINLAPEEAGRDATDTDRAPAVVVLQPTPAEPPTVQSERAERKPAAHGDSPRPARLLSRAGTRKERTGGADELSLLDQARRAVVGGGYRRALSLLDRHAGSYPKSELGEEREALRVRALKGAGLRNQAGQAASEFEARYPKSVLAPQMNKSGRSP